MRLRRPRSCCRPGQLGAGPHDVRRAFRASCSRHTVRRVTVTEPRRLRTTHFARHCRCTSGPLSVVGTIDVCGARAAVKSALGEYAWATPAGTVSRPVAACITPTLLQRRLRAAPAITWRRTVASCRRGHSTEQRVCCRQGPLSRPLGLRRCGGAPVCPTHALA